MHDDGHFDARVAANYDDPAAPEFDPALLARTADVLAGHAVEGPALPGGGNVVPFHVSDTRLGFDEYDVVNQGMVSHHVRWDRDVPVRVTVPFRYVWPAELDLMAQLAGMRLVERWADWERTPFAADSDSHVSVWERAA